MGWRSGDSCARPASPASAVSVLSAGGSTFSLPLPTALHPTGSAVLSRGGSAPTSSVGSSSPSQVRASSSRPAVTRSEYRGDPDVRSSPSGLATALQRLPAIDAVLAVQLVHDLPFADQ